MSKMRCAIIEQFGSPEVLQVKETESPQPKENQLLVRVQAAGINPIDWKQRKGNHRFILGAPFPIILGYDVSGVIEEVGSAIKNFKPGDEVIGVLDNKYGGAYAELVVGTEKCFVKKPAKVDFIQGAALSLSALTVLQAIRDKCKAQQGDTIAINGASGGVGHLALQIAKNMGLKTIAISGSKSREFVSQLNADEYIAYDEVDVLTSGLKVNHFFDVAGVYSFAKTHELLKPGGTYVNTLPRPKILAHKLLQIFTKGKKVKTLLMKHSAEDLQIISNWVDEGKLKVHIDKQFALDQVVEAHQYAQQGHSKGKNVFILD